MSPLARVLLAVIAVLSLGACDTFNEPEAEGETPAPATVGEDTVALTVYLRNGSDGDATLEPVVREVEIEGDLTRRAVELLLEGPTADEEGLEPPWPDGTAVRDVRVDGGIATVDLTEAALGGADPEGEPRLEALALAALANTLTEFPAIDRVELTVEGESAADSETVLAFWGGWGLPNLLARDDTLVGDRSAWAPEPGYFLVARQSVGSDDADPVHVRNLRVRDRITYVRLVFELADADDHDRSAAAFPRAYARPRPGGAVLEVTEVASVDEEGLAAELDERLDPYLTDLEVSEGQRPNSLRVTLASESAASKGIHLHTVDGPTRIVLDIRK